jgi:hypothetical protein
MDTISEKGNGKDRVKSMSALTSMVVGFLLVVFPLMLVRSNIPGKRSSLKAVSRERVTVGPTKNRGDRSDSGA